MKVLVIGSGAREHAIAWKLAQSSLNPTLFIAPGNAGTAGVGKNVPISVGDIDGLLSFAQDNQIDLTIVGPEQPLVDGVVDKFEAAGQPVFGPQASAAEIEGSKAFAKAFMDRHNIPTAGHKTFTSSEYDQAIAYVEAANGPLVLKASGLAAGKGVLMCPDKESGLAGLDELMKESKFGAAGDAVVIEEWMQGEEASLFAVTDGAHYVMLASSQDHKRAGDGDTGPNTGGMGSYAPAPVVTPKLLAEVEETIIKPTLKGMAEEGRTFKGFLYCGLMMTPEGPKVVEFNCRMGDPETQVVMPLLQGDLLQIILDLVHGKGSELPVFESKGAAACVVMASGGYPGSYEKGKVITGMDEANEKDQVIVFHAGTKEDGGEVVTSGGRVLGVTAFGDELAEVLEKAYSGIECIDFEGKQFRRDIGQKGLAHLS